MMYCTECAEAFSTSSFASELLRPDLCGRCWIKITEPKRREEPETMATTLNLKQKRPAGQCAAMRCTMSTTAPADEVLLTLPDGPVRCELCEKHYGLAIAAFGGSHVCRQVGENRPTNTEGPMSGHPPFELLGRPGESEAMALVNEASEALDVARTYEIRSQADLDFAAEVLQETKARARYVLERKEAITKPLNAALKAARDLFRPAEEKFAAVELTFKAAIVKWQGEQEERNRAAVEAAAEAHAAGDPNAAAAALASMASVQDTAGVSIRHTFRFDIVNEAEVPRVYCTADRAKITTYMREAIETCRAAGMPDEEIPEMIGFPGVTFWREAGVAVRS